MRLNHVGLVVRDLAAAAQFFQDLGFTCEGPAEVGGPWVDRVIGISGARSRIMFVNAPDGGASLELTEFSSPASVEDPIDLPANSLGLRHVAYEVQDIQALITKAQAAGYPLVGEVVDYQDVYRLAYIRGPEGLLLELAQPL